MKFDFFMLLILIAPLTASYAIEQGNMTGMNFSETEQGTTSAELSDFSANTVLAFKIDSGPGPKAEPPDFTARDLSSCNTSNYQSQACMNAKDLISLSPDSIRDYGLNDYDGKVIEKTLELLDSGNLTKVLQNIPPEGLIQIRDKVTSGIFNNTISIVPEPEQVQILNKLSSKQ